MKTIMLALSCLIAATAFSQTNIIAAKSHQGNPDDYLREGDNFGLPGDYDVIDTVKFIEAGCIVEIGRYRQIDTLRSEAFTEEPTAEFLNRYEPGTVFIGFKNVKHTIRHSRKQFNQHMNGLTELGWIVLVLLIGSMLYNLRSVN